MEMETEEERIERQQRYTELVKWLEEHLRTKSRRIQHHSKKGIFFPWAPRPANRPTLNRHPKKPEVEE